MSPATIRSRPGVKVLFQGFRRFRNAVACPWLSLKNLLEVLFCFTDICRLWLNVPERSSLLEFRLRDLFLPGCHVVSRESRELRGKAAVTKQRPEAGNSQLAPLFAKGLCVLQLLGFLQFGGRFFCCHGFSPSFGSPPWAFTGLYANPGPMYRRTKPSARFYGMLRKRLLGYSDRPVKKGNTAE